MRTLMLAAVGMTLMMVAPSAMAVHGEPYEAYGTAVNAAGDVFLAEVTWSGYWTQTFVVTLRDSTGAVVATESFAGTWTANGPVFYFWEVLNYHAWSTYGGSAHFDIKGVQAQQVVGGGPQRAIMLYTGNFYDNTLTLVVPYGITL